MVESVSFEGCIILLLICLIISIHLELVIKVINNNFITYTKIGVIMMWGFFFKFNTILFETIALDNVDTKIIMCFTVVQNFVFFVLLIIFIQRFGLYGAAYSFLISSVFNYTTCTIYVSSIFKIINFRYITLYFFLIFFVYIALYRQEFINSYVFQFIIIALIFFNLFLFIKKIKLCRVETV